MTVERPADSPHFVARHDGAVTPGDQLVVADGDRCVFYRHGQALRVLEPGRYTIPAEFAGDGIEAWFVRGVFRGLKFGGSIGTIPTPDGVVKNAYGEYSVRVTDPTRLLSNVVGMGTDAAASEQSLRRYLGQSVLKMTQMAIAKHASSFGPAVLGEVMDDIRRQSKELGDLGVSIEVGSLGAS